MEELFRLGGVRYYADTFRREGWILRYRCTDKIHEMAKGIALRHDIRRSAALQGAMKGGYETVSTCYMTAVAVGYHVELPSNAYFAWMVPGLAVKHSLGRCGVICTACLQIPALCTLTMVLTKVKWNVVINKRVDIRCSMQLSELFDRINQLDSNTKRMTAASIAAPPNTPSPTAPDICSCQCGAYEDVRV